MRSTPDEIVRQASRMLRLDPGLATTFFEGWSQQDKNVLSHKLRNNMTLPVVHFMIPLPSLAGTRLWRGCLTPVCGANRYLEGMSAKEVELDVQTTLLTSETTCRLCKRTKKFKDHLLSEQQ